MLACVDKDGGDVLGNLTGGFNDYSAVGSDPSFLQSGSWCKSISSVEVGDRYRLTQWTADGREGASTVLSGALHKTGDLTGYTGEVEASTAAAEGAYTLGPSTNFGAVACGADLDSDGTIEPGESCEGTWRLMLKLEQLGDCGDPVNTNLFFESETVESMRIRDDDTTCVAGSGRFVLLPGYVGDRDDDDYQHGVYYAAQESGSGTMTNHAWITEIEVVDDDGMDLRVVHVDEPIAFDANDVLLDRSSNSTALTGTHGFSSGEVSGNPGFVLEDIPAAVHPEVVVDMSWTCSSSGGKAWVGAQGFVLDLDAIGCGVEQKLVMRPETHFLRWQVYGDPTHSIRTFTNNVPAGRAFVASHLGIDVQGVVTAITPTSATLRLDSIEMDGVDLCTPGTYTLPAL